MRKTIARLLALSVLVNLVVCISCDTPPSFTGVQPAQGVPRQILAVDGTDLFGSTVLWDAGLGTQVPALATFLGSRYFQIPAAASVGLHPVQLERNGFLSTNIVNITVNTMSGTWPAPRIEDTGLIGITATGGNNADVWLSISVANVDPDATVTVNGVAVNTAFASAITNDKFNTLDAATFTYPVYHYGLLWVEAGNQVLGTTLGIVVTNKDGQTGSYTYPLAGTIAEIDSDNDGLLDDWEINGYPIPGGGGTRIDLAAMGCHHQHKDILIETDWIAAAAPDATIWAIIEGIFATAPVLNPDGTQGISIHIDRGQGAPFDQGGTILTDHTTMDFGANITPGYANFFDYKAASFDIDRLNIFHYCVFGRNMPSNASGRGEIWGNDFIVTFSHAPFWLSPLAQVGTFVHELGHNLGLRHGGIDNAAVDADFRNKPNLPSSLNYRYQFGGVSTNCDFTPEMTHTYSMGMYRRVNEPSVNENTGICNNAPLDMNENGTITIGPMDVNKNGSSGDVHFDYNQWGNLKLNFRASGSRWNSN